MPWLKYKLANDWGNIFYHASARPRVPPDIDVYHREIGLICGDLYEIIWPDGTLSTDMLVGVRSNTTVSDTGHRYDVEQKRLGFEVTYRGCTFFVELHKVTVKKK